jgi:hypothetical protein
VLLAGFIQFVDCLFGQALDRLKSFARCVGNRFACVKAIFLKYLNNLYRRGERGGEGKRRREKEGRYMYIIVLVNRKCIS